MQQYQIVYVSKSMLSKEIDLRTTEIQRILEVSRKWNSENDITGALMFGEGYFAQVLEGPSSILKSTFGFIACDERHRNVRLLECGPVLKRAFESWSMAYTDGDGDIDLCMVDLVIPPLRSPTGLTILERLRSLVRPDPVVGANP
jgi:hypothetical protein